MPGFYRDKDFYLITYITGPSHIYLGLSFEGEVLDEPILIKKPAIGDCKHGGLDEEQIKNAVLEGIALGNSNFNTYLNPTKILYVVKCRPHVYQRRAAGVYHPRSGEGYHRPRREREFRKEVADNK